MKPFNLEKALAGEPVVTRDGERVTQLVLFHNVGECQPLAGVVGNVIRSWHASGEYYGREDKSALDLFMATKKRTVYINVFQLRGGVMVNCFDTESEAKAVTSGSNERIKYHTIAMPHEIEE